MQEFHKYELHNLPHILFHPVVQIATDDSYFIPVKAKLFPAGEVAV
jgi:hypothetical protein